MLGLACNIGELKNTDKYPINKSYIFFIGQYWIYWFGTLQRRPTYTQQQVLKVNTVPWSMLKKKQLNGMQKKLPLPFRLPNCRWPRCETPIKKTQR